MKRLYKKTTTGKIQTWCIEVVDNMIFSESGQVGGVMTKSIDVIKEGKNIGKANETTPQQQAHLEAQSKWTAKKKKGYVESIDDASNDVVGDDIEGGYLPMLAKVFEKDERNIIYPCAAQPKLDGNRCCYSGKLYSRTRKRIISVPHIEKWLTEHVHTELDGELYNHEMKDDFERLSHIIGQKKTPDVEHELIQYHVYDIPINVPFSERMKLLQNLKALCEYDINCPIKIVETVICQNKEELMAYRENCLEMGYEGAMVRNLHGKYENKRSSHLQKLKIMEDAEFKIVGVDEGRGKLRGHAGSFICVTPEGNEFNAKLKGDIKKLKEYYEHIDRYIGKDLTVQFQGYTNRNNVPRFPVGLRIRED